MPRQMVMATRLLLVFAIFSLLWTRSPEDFPGIDTVDLNLYSCNLTVHQWTLIQSLAKKAIKTGSFSKTFSKIDFSETIFNSAFTFSAEPSQSLRSFSHLIDRAKFAALDVFWSLIGSFGPGLWNHTHNCEAWYAQDPGPPNDLIPCPPTAAQANADPRFEPDSACTSPPCNFHPGADFCIRSRAPSPSGGGQQCCYKGNNILLGPPGGGTVDKCHYKKYYIPLCHFVKDVVPWAKCCYNKTLELCHLYYEKRPSDPGTNYISPGLQEAQAIRTPPSTA
jgi:hypothetical protein